jgi:hypothetical protein
VPDDVWANHEEEADDRQAEEAEGRADALPVEEQVGQRDQRTGRRGLLDESEACTGDCRRRALGDVHRKVSFAGACLPRRRGAVIGAG